MNRTDLKNFFDFFSRDVSITMVTNNTSQTVAVGPLDLFQIQLDTTQSDTVTTIEISDGSNAPVKRVTFSGVGTREVTFLGRPFRVNDHLFISRPDGDTHLVYLTYLYRPV